MSVNTVVPKITPLPEDDFHAALMEDWARMIAKWKKPAFALKAGYSNQRQLHNVLNGSIPGALSIFNLLAEDDAAIDKVLERYGLRAVPRDAHCSSDPSTLPLATLLCHVAEAEHPESHGGTQITEHEARAIPEEDLLAVERVTARIRQLRKPKVVSA